MMWLGREAFPLVCVASVLWKCVTPWHWLCGSMTLESGLSAFLSLLSVKKKMGMIGPVLTLLLSGFVYVTVPLSFNICWNYQVLKHVKSWSDPWRSKTELWGSEEGRWCGSDSGEAWRRPRVEAFGLWPFKFGHEWNNSLSVRAACI